MNATGNLDPRTKIFLVACVSSAALVITHWAFLAALLGISVLLLMVFRVSLWRMIKQIRMLLYMVLAIAVIQSVFVSAGQALVTIGGTRILTAGGLMLAGEFILRMLVIVASAGILSTSNSREIIQGLVQWKLPYEIAFMAYVGIRFLPVLAEEFRDTLVAVQLRGVDLKSLGIRQKMEVFTCLFQPVVAGTVLKSRELAMSIEMRGFRAHPTRTSFLGLTLTRRDYAVMMGSALFTAGIIAVYCLV